MLARLFLSKMPMTNVDLDKLQKRFWSNVDKTSYCWNWIGYTFRKSRKNGDVRGRIHFQGKYHYVHRVSWQLHFGPIPEGLHVCHHCDNPICVRPDHLFVGTNADNVRDKVSKGRQCVGSGNASAKLDEGKVKEIRHRFPNEKAADLAEEFGVSTRLIHYVCSCKFWSHV